MTQPPAEAHPGFDRPETVEVRATLKDFLIAAIVPTIFLFLISWLILGAIGLPVARGIPRRFRLHGGDDRGKEASAREGTEGHIADDQPPGLIVDDPATTLEIAWSGVRAVGLAKGPKGVDLRRTPLPFLGRGGATIGSDIGSADRPSRFTTQIGILGLGTHALKPNAPAQARWQFEQNVGINGVDEETGQDLIAVLAQTFDRKWQSDRIGDWVRTYRPDVMPASS